MKIPVPSKFSAILFATVLFPATILCFFAIGSFEKERAFLEQQYRGLLEDEITDIHSRANIWLKNMHGEMVQVLADGEGPRESPDWAKSLKAKTALIDVPFILDPDSTIVYPPQNTADPAEIDFLKKMGDFLRLKETVPTYANFMNNISQDIKFSNVYDIAESGIIPVDIKGSFNLIFWKRSQNQQIIGALLDRKFITGQIAKLIPQNASENRILTILDEHSKPIAPVSGQAKRDWRQTYCSREISRALPNWRIATYLIDPDQVSAKAKNLSNLLRIIAYSMLFLLTIGLILIIHLLMEKIKLAQERAAFATHVSHELKTPLTSIQMFAQILRDKKGDAQNKQDQYLDIILSETERLKRLINNVLDFTSLEKRSFRYHLAVVDIVEICRMTIESQRERLTAKGFQLNFEVAQTPVYVMADADALTRVLLNLLVNAEQYSYEDKFIFIQLHADGRFVYIEVKDHGCGVPLDLKERIFEEYYRVESALSAKTQGTGLGLSIARKIIRDHGGDIVCVPSDKGALFRIQLPTKEKNHD